MKASISFIALVLAYGATSSIVHAQDTFAYQIAVDEVVVNGNSDIIHWDTSDPSSGQSKGTVKFCARVETFMDGLGNTEVATATEEFKIEIPFDLTNDLLDVGSEVEVNMIDEEDGDLQNFFEVEACRCTEGLTDDSFTCLSDTDSNMSKLHQNEMLFVCLQPNSTQVNITNFDLSITNEMTAISYKAVDLGPSQWIKDELTTIQTKGVVKEGKTLQSIKIHVLLVPSVFGGDAETLKVSGKALLTLLSAEARMLELKSFEMDVGIINEPDDECRNFFSKMLNLLK